MSSFRSRILWLILIVTVGVQVATVTTLVIQTNHRARDQAGKDLDSTGKVLDALLSARAERIQQAVTVLATDYGFRKAMTLHDRLAIVAALDDSARRVDAQLAVLIDTTGELVSATSQQLDAAPSAELMRFAQLANTNSTVGYRTLGDVPYMLVSAPVATPAHVGTVIIGFAIDASLTQQFSILVGYPVGFAAQGHAGMKVVVDNNSARYNLAAAINSPSVSLQQATVLKLGAESYMTKLVDVSGSDNRLQLILYKPLDDALGPYAHARTGILGVAALALLLTIPIARVIANATSRPLEQLVTAARRIESGNYAEAVAFDAPEEFRMVATTLNSMQQNIADREERILRQAISDELTGLPNRTWAVEHLETVERSGVTPPAPVALILLQIKDFDRIRASLGHDLSDTVVREVARRLLSFRGQDDYVARVALSQFLYIAPNLGEQASNGLARTLLQSVRTGLICGGVPVHLDAHIGICVYPNHAVTMQDLLRRLDTALYDASEHGDAIRMYEPGRDERHRRQLGILGDLRRATDSNELELYYQPKIDMRSHAVHGLEALVRWTHPIHGRIAPAEFVPLAEKTGNIALLTNWVLKTVLKQMRDWQSQGFRPDISVNLSAADLLDRELTDLIVEHLQLPDAQPHRLIFEITESSVMRDTTQVIAVMERLRQYKVRFSIDDFGTGFSSLAQFKHLPVDEIKIDKSFVLELTADSDDAAIVRSTIDLGHNFGVKVVAEGVETSDSWRALLDLGCDLAQGFLISRPVPVDQVIATVNNLNDRLQTAHTATQQLRALRLV